MNDFIIALLLACGAGGWIYSRFARTTGGNTKTSLIASISSGLAILLIAWYLFGLLH